MYAPNTWDWDENEWDVKTGSIANSFKLFDSDGEKRDNTTSGGG